jgi:DNA-directed RNA polymerase subunit beta'
MVHDGDEVSRPATCIAKIPRETTKTKDITGGLPARRGTLRGAQAARDRGHVEIDGTVKLGAISKGKRRLIVVATTARSAST